MFKLYRILFIFIMLSAQYVQTQWITIFAHGIVDNAHQINRFAPVIATQNRLALSFADSDLAQGWNLNTSISYITRLCFKKNINRGHMFFGQGPDIQTVQDSLNAHPDDKIVLFGCSRGGHAILQALGNFDTSKVKAIVLDATPLDTPATIAFTLAKLGINPSYAPTTFHAIFPGYNPEHQSIIEAISKIKNKKLPILLIHSKTDTAVPVTQSYQLYQAFRQHGFCNTHLIIFEKGKHSFLINDLDIQQQYLQAVHTFYKKYKLPFDQTWTQTHYDLEAYKPDDTTMTQAIANYQQLINQTYHQAYMRNISVLTALILYTLYSFTKKL